MDRPFTYPLRSTTTFTVVRTPVPKGLRDNFLLLHGRTGSLSTILFCRAFALGRITSLVRAASLLGTGPGLAFLLAAGASFLGATVLASRAFRTNASRFLAFLLAAGASFLGATFLASRAFRTNASRRRAGGLSGRSHLFRPGRCCSLGRSGLVRLAAGKAQSRHSESENQMFHDCLDFKGLNYIFLGRKCGKPGDLSGKGPAHPRKMRSYVFYSKFPKNAALPTKKIITFQGQAENTHAIPPIPEEPVSREWIGESHGDGAPWRSLHGRQYFYTFAPSFWAFRGEKPPGKEKQGTLAVALETHESILLPNKFYRRWLLLAKSENMRDLQLH